MMSRPNPKAVAVGAVAVRVAAVVVPVVAAGAKALASQAVVVAVGAVAAAGSRAASRQPKPTFRMLNDPMACCDNHSAPLTYPTRVAAVLAVLLGWLILSQDIGLTVWFALLLVATGIHLINRKPRVR